jgi:hypothetical protein
MKGWVFIAKDKSTDAPNIYATPARITVRDAAGKIVGVGSVGQDGKFALQVESSAFYEITAESPPLKGIVAVSNAEAVSGNLTINIGKLCS